MDKIHKCDKCSYASYQLSNFKNHKCIQTRKKPYKCDICSYACTTASILKVHKRTHTNERPFKCEICSYASIQSGGLKKHMQVHTKEAPYTCSLCPYASAWPNALKVHMRTHSQDGLHKCNQCSYVSNYKRTLQKHMSTHDRDWTYQCKQCSYTSTSITTMQMHIRYHSRGFGAANSNSVNAAVIHYSAGLYKCNQCSYVSASFRNAQAHMRIHFDGPCSDTSRSKYAQSNRNQSVNGRENAVFTAENDIASTPSSSCSLSAQSNLSESVNGTVHTRTDLNKRYNCTQYPYVNASFKAVHLQMRSRAGRLHCTSSNNTYGQAKNNNNKDSQNIVPSIERDIIPTALPLYSFSDTNDFQRKAETTNGIDSIAKSPAIFVANDNTTANFFPAEYMVDETVDFDVEEQANKCAADMLFKNSIIYENLRYADYTEDDFDFNVNVVVE